jgi:4-carboxymuconolactone decarboxylase
MRNLIFASAACLMTLIPAGAQTPDPTKVKMFGDRFQPLEWGEMTKEQQTMITNLVTGERGTTTGPFNALLRSPEMGDIAQKLGAQVRFHSELPENLKEMAILITARHWTAQYEWIAHRRLAEAAMLKPAIIAAIREGKRPEGMTADEQTIYNFTTELLKTSQVSDATFQAMKATFGERRVVNLVGLMGYYSMVSMLLNVDRYPIPDGSKPELLPLK